MASYFKDVGKELSNWGRWGADDQLGTLNLVTPQHVASAAGAVRSGRVVQLSIPVGADGPQTGVGGRLNPIHLMSMQPSDWDLPHGVEVSDDWILMPLQSGTQWDGLAHVSYDGQLYNAYPSSSIGTRSGARVLSVDALTSRMVGRGVLLDIARLRGVEWLEAGETITPADLEAAEREAEVRVGAGDFLLVRTGWRRAFLESDTRSTWLEAEPGLSEDCAAWLHDRGVAAVGSDNWGVEVSPAADPTQVVPLHCILIRDMGMPLAEMLDLEELSAACADEQRWTFFFVAAPLRVSNAIGSPTTPIAVL